MSGSMIGEQVRPLEAIVYTYGRCCQPDASIIDMTPSPADKNLVEKGEISQEEHDLAERQYKASKAVAELVCNDCVVRPQCRQYCLYAKATGIAAGSPVSPENKYRHQKLTGAALSDFVERAVRDFPVEPDRPKKIAIKPMEQMLGLDNNAAADYPLSLVQNG